MRVLVIDNYDSFTFNLVQYLGELGVESIVVKNDAIDVAGIAKHAPDGVLVSPGRARRMTRASRSKRCSVRPRPCSACASVTRRSGRPSAATSYAPIG